MADSLISPDLSGPAPLDFFPSRLSRSRGSLGSLEASGRVEGHRGGVGEGRKKVKFDDFDEKVENVIKSSLD